MVYLVMILIWRFGESIKLTVRYYQAIYTASMGFLHTVRNSANLKSHQ